MPFGPFFERRTHLIQLRTMNRHRLFSIAILALAACFSLSVEAAPPKKTFAVQGEVVSATSGSPVDFASVLVTPSQLYTMTDTKGSVLSERRAGGDSHRQRAVLRHGTERHHVYSQDR